MFQTVRLRITLSMLFTSVAALILVGASAHWLLMREFNSRRKAGAFENFRKDMAAYIEAYGSLEEARAAEPFPEFEQRRRHEEMQRGEAPEPIRFRTPEPEEGGFGPGGGPPPPFPGEGGPPGGGPPGGGPPGEGAPPGGGPPGGGPPGAERLSAEERVPFRFLVIDAEGRALEGDPSYALGDQVPEELRKQAEPVLVNGIPAVYAVPLGTPNLNTRDRQYLQAIGDAMRVSLAGAVLLALVLGVAFGTALSRNLHELAAAIRSMGEGELGRQVPVRGKDEVAMVALSFNRMSTELAAARERLEASQKVIQEQADRLLELSVRDALTGLHNRRYFDEHAALALQLASRQGRPFSVAIMDVDHFKQVNDRFSHATGDEVLKKVAALVRGSARATDLVARYGGEEFVIALPDADGARAAEACERVRAAIEAYDWSQVHPDLRVTTSIGVDADGEGGLEERLKIADQRLYRAKQSGRNRVISEG